VVGRIDDDDVEIFFFKHLAVVAVGPRPAFGGLARGNHVDGLVEHPAIDIAQGHHLDGYNLQEAE